MSTLLIVVAVLGGLLGLCALAGAVWLARALEWRTLEDDATEPPAGRGRGWPASWFRPQRGLLTYRRDRLGRFRKYRR